eukprot:3656584-Amphidinium_carterae.1
MARTRGMSPKSQAMNAARVQAEKCLKDDLKRCQQILKDFPSVRSACKLYLEALIGDREAKDVPESAQSLESKGRDAMKLKMKERKEIEKEEKKLESEKGVIPSKYNTLQKCSETLLRQKVLPAIDKVALSDANVTACMKALGVKDADTKVQKMLDIVEFCTGEPRTLPLTSTMRTWDVLLQHLRDAAAERNRHFGLCLPVDWAAHGVYNLELLGQEIVITHRFSSERHSFSVDCLAVPPKKITDLVIQQNHSELSACLSVGEEAMPRGFKPYRFTSLFQNQAGKRRLAITYSTPTKRQRGEASRESA